MCKCAKGGARDIKHPSFRDIHNITDKMNKQEGEEATWTKGSCIREYTCNYSDLQRRALKAVTNIVSSLITRCQVLLQTVPSRRTFVQYLIMIFEQSSTLMSKRSQNARQFFVNKKTKTPLIKALQTQNHLQFSQLNI